MCLRPLITHKQEPLVQLYIMKLWIVMIPSQIHTKSIKWLQCYYWEFSSMVASFDLFESQNISYLDTYLPSIHMPSSNLSTFQPSLTKKVRAKSYSRKSSSKKQVADTSQDKASFLRIRSGISFSLSNTFPIWCDYLPLFLGSSRWESLVVSLEKQFM